LLIAAGAATTATLLVLRWPVPRQATPGIAGYVGSAACTPCHGEVVSAWQGSAHHLAMLPALPDAPLWAPLDAAPLVRRDGRLVMTAAALGRPADVPLHYVLGRRRIEQYIGSLVPARLQALPLAFDVAQRRWFDLFEDEEREPEDWGHWTNRGMNANAQCLACHTTGYDKGYEPATDGYRSRWVEMGVGCEACHGPGQAHVAARGRAPATRPGGQAPTDALLDRCAPCHGRSVARAPLAPEGTFLDAFEPDLLDTEAYHPDGQVREEVYEFVSFAMSKMFARGVRCWDCHDVHAGGLRRTANQLCLGCHATTYEAWEHTRHPPSSAGAQCVGCHMPVTVFMKRDPRHDHAFTLPDPDATLALGIPNACNRCHEDRPASWAATHVAEWFPQAGERERRRALARTIAQGRASDATAVPGLLALVAGDADVVRRASAARLLARFPTAEGVTAGLGVAVDDPEPLVRAGAAWALAERAPPSPEARARLLHALADPVRIVRLHAALGLRDVDPQTLDRAARNTLAAAAAEWRRSQDLHQDTPEAHHNLAIFHAVRGEAEAAIAEYRAALRLWPAAVAPRHNLAMLLAEQGRPAEAEAEFAAVLARGPVPESALALGLLYAQEERWSDAVRALEQCVAADAAFPRARYNLGLAYARTGDTTRALDALERATGDPAAHEEAVRAIIGIARAAGDRPRLERWLPEAIRLDPSLAAVPALAGP
jgi:predicted CXXCH cytochrome family protein